MAPGASARRCTATAVVPLLLLLLVPAGARVRMDGDDVPAAAEAGDGFADLPGFRRQSPLGDLLSAIGFGAPSALPPPPMIGRTPLLRGQRSIGIPLLPFLGLGGGAGGPGGRGHVAGLGSLLGELSGTALKTYPFPADCEPELDGKCVGLVRVCEPGAPCGLECQAKTPPRVSKACKSKHPCAEDAERLCEFVGSRSEIFDCLVGKRGNVTDACRASEPCLQSLTHNKCDHQPGKSHGKGGGRGGAGASKPGGKQPLNFGSFMRDIFGMDDSEEGEDEGEDFIPRAIHRSKHASKRAHDLENREASVAEREKLLDRSRAEVQREREELDREFKFAHQMTNPHSALNTMEKLKYHDAGDSALPADDESSGARTSGPRSALAAVFLTFLAGSMGIVLACPAGAE